MGSRTEVKEQPSTVQDCVVLALRFLLAKGWRNVRLVLGLTSLEGNVFLCVFLAAVGGESVCLCVGCNRRVERVLFFPLLWDWSSQPGQCELPALQPWMGSTGSHSLRGADLTSLHWQIRQSSFGQQRSCTIQMLISSCRVVPRCLLLRFDWILPQDPTWPNQIPTAYL